MSEKIDINRKVFSPGDIVYYVGTEGNGSARHVVKWGIVEENYTSEIAVRLYDINRIAIINGKPAYEIEFPTKWKKLPKGWSYDTKLFELEWVCPEKEILMEAKINDPESIKKAIECGAFESVENISYCGYYAEIDKQGWRIREEYCFGKEYHAPYVSLHHNNVYGTYEEAAEIVKEYEEELKRQAELSYEEWSVEQITNNINRYTKIYGMSEEDRTEVFERLTNLDNVGDVVTRIFSGCLEWKYDRNRRWNVIYSDNERKVL